MRKNVKQQLFTFTFLYRKVYILLKTYLEKLSLYCYICITVFSKCQVVGNAVTPTFIYILTVFAVTILRSKILDNGLGILTQILTATDYFFNCIFQTYSFNLEKKDILIWAINFIIKSIRKGIEILAKRLFSFSIIVLNMTFLVILFIRKSICQGRLFGSLHTSNWIYLLWNCFSNYV